MVIRDNVRLIPPSISSVFRDPAHSGNVNGMTYAAKKKAALANRRIVLPAPNAAGISDLFELSVDIFGAFPNHTRSGSVRTFQALRATAGRTVLPRLGNFLPHGEIPHDHRTASRMNFLPHDSSSVAISRNVAWGPRKNAE